MDQMDETVRTPSREPLKESASSRDYQMCNGAPFCLLALIKTDKEMIYIHLITIRNYIFLLSFSDKCQNTHSNLS